MSRSFWRDRQDSPAMRVQLELKPYRSPTAARGAGKYTSAAQSSDLGSAAQRGVGSVSAQDCRTGLITRVVLRGADAPQEKPLQWILGKLLSDLSSSPVSGQAHSFTEWDPLSSTLVLHVDSSEEGEDDPMDIACTSPADRCIVPRGCSCGFLGTLMTRKQRYRRISRRRAPMCPHSGACSCRDAKGAQGMQATWLSRLLQGHMTQALAWIAGRRVLLGVVWSPYPR